jgi:hypothetical protein
MKKPYIIPTSNEPIGIVISRGSRAEPTPIFASYVWDSTPLDTATTTKAA